MAALLRHWPRILISLVPLVLALFHTALTPRRPLIDGLDFLIYDWRLRATMPESLDSRIVIVDVDDASLQAVGQWPWGRDKLARLTNELMDRQQVAVLGFDVVFAEADKSSGLANLKELARGPLRDNVALANELPGLEDSLDYDGSFAKSLAGHRVALGYYFTQGSAPLSKGALPPPTLPVSAFPAGGHYVNAWNGFGGNIELLAKATATAGFINAAIGPRSDGLLRVAPLIAYYEGGGNADRGYYESLGLAVYRLAVDNTAIAPIFAGRAPGGTADQPAFAALALSAPGTALRVPITQSGSLVVPFRGYGGATGGSFQYVSAGDVLNGALAPGDLKGKIVLVGTTAPGLQDLRATPVGATFPGVEVHANVVSALLDGRMLSLPDYALGYEWLVLLLAGLVLAVGLSVQSIRRAVMLFVVTMAAVIALNTWLFLAHQLVLPLASAIVTLAFVFAVNMAWGYFIEARARRGLANLFGSYVPPQLVEKMLLQPGNYSMRAENKVLTAMFCDMRGFTQLAENLPPLELQAFLNAIFSRLTDIISRHGGTVDKYMGDCVMAFWGAPVDMPKHATQAVRAAMDMAAAMYKLNAVDEGEGRPPVAVGIGLNTGTMSVGDMGSAARRSYTVIGDAVNLASRLEGLGSIYGVPIVAGAITKQAVEEFTWQELDRVVVKGRHEIVTIYAPVCLKKDLSAPVATELALWAKMLAAYQAKKPDEAERFLDQLLAQDAKKVLYRLYAERIASMRLPTFDPQWDGATRFESK